MKRRAEELVKLAAQDVLAAIGLEKIKNSWEGKICTEVHASIEKGLKALIVELGGEETTHHSIAECIRDYERLSGEEIPEEFDDIDTLDECGVGTRYSFRFTLTLSKQEFVQLATDFHKWIRSQLS